MRQLSERRRKLTMVVVLLGGVGNTLGRFLHAHRMGTVAVGAVVALQVWAFVLLAKPDRKEG